MEDSAATSVYRMVERAIEERRHQRGGVLGDVGCGSATLWKYVSRLSSHYVGGDAVQYDGFPIGATFCRANLNTERVNCQIVSEIPLPQTIEHLENPRALARELVRLTNPGGWIIITTPNQLSLASLPCLCLKKQFQHFQDGSGRYPTHVTALLEIDLLRIARENSLNDVALEYSKPQLHLAYDLTLACVPAMPRSTIRRQPCLSHASRPLAGGWLSAHPHL